MPSKKQLEIYDEAAKCRRRSLRRQAMLELQDFLGMGPVYSRKGGETAEMK